MFKFIQSVDRMRQQDPCALNYMVSNLAQRQLCAMLSKGQLVELWAQRKPADAEPEHTAFCLKGPLLYSGWKQRRI